MRYRITLHNDCAPPGQPDPLVVELGEGERCVIGRGKTAHVVCNTGACSREHCSIEAENGVFFLADSGSSNGTWLNGQRVQRAAISSGAVIHAGKPGITVLNLEVLPD